MQNVSTRSPIVKEIPWIEPSALFKSVALKQHVFYLDSSLHSDRLGRYSYVGFEPYMTCSVSGSSARIEENTVIRNRHGDPFEIIESLMERHRVPTANGPAPFMGGAVGYIGYELRHFVEKLPKLQKPRPGYADAWFGFYNTLVAFDHKLNKAYFISHDPASAQAFLAEVQSACPEPVEGAASLSAGVNEWVSPSFFLISPSRKGRGQGKVLEAGNIDPREVKSSLTKPSSNISFDAYVHMVRKAKRYIEEGEIYQANLSQQFKCSVSLPSHKLYMGLRSKNPAPFSCYLDTGEIQILSSSPERFLKVDGAHIETRPIKGTMPRGSTPEEDARNADKLQASAKDRAEHIMIVDLERNDLGRVCVPASVTVDELMTPEKYATVHHLTSTITGALRPGASLSQILKATFPGGSITGAPKIRAMQIIDELEPASRGVYTGAIGYLGFDGILDLNIAIRTIVVKDGVATFNLGGGIVYDSDPQKEYQETLDKGKAIFDLLSTIDSHP